MKRSRKLIALCVVLAMVVMLFAACGSGNSGSKSGGDTFKIGGIGPTTGAAAIYGNAAKNGAQIAVDEINAAGGINGVQIEYQFEDDVHDPEKSVSAYNTLRDWGMQMMVGTVTTAPCVAVATQANADRLFMITPSASSTDVINAGDTCYQVCFTDPNQGKVSADYIKEHNLAQNVAVIYDSSDIYSSGLQQSFEAEAAAIGLNVVSSTAFTSDTNTDFYTQLQKAKDSNADLVFLPFYYTEASKVLQQANSMGYAPKFFGCDGLDGILGVEGFDTALAEGAMLLTPFAADAQDAATQSFVKQYQDKFGELPNQFAADAYDAVYILKAAIEKAGITPEMTPQDICEKIIETMATLSVDGLTGSGMTWDANGAVAKEPKAVAIQNGAYVAM
ncbi:MAG: ABC transporter substrate-binding protein [Clostridia bacterium]|nr:ABC transporter substrate-binding protein [Clostridia bacterium]